MSAVLQEPPTGIRLIDGPASSAGWCACGPGIEVKVLAIDPARHSVEYLARTAPGHTTGLHRHHAEAYLYILQGSVTNLASGVEFRQGDFCYQPCGDEHEEVTGPDGAMAYVSQRGVGDLMAEFLDRDGRVLHRYTLGEFAALMTPSAR